MACYHPQKGYRSIEKTANGKHTFTKSERHGNTAYPMTIPCGYCIGCRLERSRQWAMRCIAEAKMHERNCFITLTFSEEAMKKRGHRSLAKRDFQLFMKKLRKKMGKKKIRFYHCGEYGPKLGRAHYHACLFGIDFEDKKFWKYSKPNQAISITSKFKLYRSPTLEKLWPHGWSSIGALTFETAAYTARYILKKQLGKTALEHYNTIDKTTGEITEEKLPEYTTMSRRPGIGNSWYEKYKTDIYPKDYVTMRGRNMKPPRYWDKLLERENEKLAKKVKARRKTKMAKNPSEQKTDRLLTKEKVTKLNQKQLKRSYEDEPINAGRPRLTSNTHTHGTKLARHHTITETNRSESNQNSQNDS